MTNAYSDVSFWFDSMGEVPEPTVPELPAETEVAVIGAGFTGLWTAYYLNQKHPELDISVFEAETVGYGASGRNGGWCMGEASGLDDFEAEPANREAASVFTRRCSTRSMKWAVFARRRESTAISQKAVG